jgi:hypothetical protein
MKMDYNGIKKGELKQPTGNYISRLEGGNFL